MFGVVRSLASERIISEELSKVKRVREQWHLIFKIGMRHVDCASCIVCVYTNTRVACHGRLAKQ